MEKVIAQLRLAVVLFTAAAFLSSSAAPAANGLARVGLWSLALAYAAAVVLLEPYRRAPLIAWEVASGLADWALITLGILATGAERSDLYTLYFLSVVSIGLRFGFREVVVAAVGTAAGYLALVLATTHAASQAVLPAGLRMIYLLLVAVGVGVLAGEASRHFRARVKEGARRLAVQEVTTTVSHDLMNPIAAVYGLVEMLLGSAADTLTLDQRALLHRIDANTQQMSNLVSNLLDAELIERGQQSFLPTPLDLNALVRRVVEAQAHQAEVKQIGLVLDLSPRLQLAMLDGRMIERLVANLLSNAVKFCPHNGAVRVSTGQRDCRVSVEVWNSGSEVPADLQPVLFEKFTRHHDSQGIGLGLYICKSVVDAHRGKLSVRNVPDGGVAFLAELPMAVSAKVGLPASAQGRSPLPAGLRLGLRTPSTAEAS